MKSLSLSRETVLSLSPNSTGDAATDDCPQGTGGCPTLGDCPVTDDCPKQTGGC